MYALNEAISTSVLLICTDYDTFYLFLQDLHNYPFIFGQPVITFAYY